MPEHLSENNWTVTNWNPRPLTFAQKRMLDFFQTFIAGCPTSHSRLGHINSAIQVNGRKGLWKFFCRMNPMMDVQFTTFMANLRRYLEKTGFRGLDSAHVDHNVCPTCRMFNYEEDTLVLQRSLLNDEERDHSAIEKLRDIQHKQERLAEKVEEHGRRNAMCRGHVSWWQNQAQFATAATKGYDTNLDVRHGGVPRIAMWHVDGEASRQIPHARLDSVGGGFVGRKKMWASPIW